jgi:hypothetical protein
MDILIYCALDEGTLNQAQERFDVKLESRGLTQKEGSPNIWVCGDCFNAADDAIRAVHESAEACGVVVKRAFAVVDKPNSYADEGET